MLGAEYRYDTQNERCVCSHIPSDVRLPKVSAGSLQSQTLNGGLYADSAGFSYIDPPGPDDNRGDEEKEWAVWTIAMTLSILDRLQGVIVVIDYSTVKDDRATGILIFGLTMSLEVIVL